MSFKISLGVGGALAALLMTIVAATAEDVAEPAAEPSLYSAAYLHPSKAVGPHHDPYEGAVASTYANVVRVPGQHGHVVVKAASHKTVDTPFSSAHKSDVRFINDGVAPYYPPYAAGPHAYGPVAAPVLAAPYAAVPRPYAPAAPYAAAPYPYAPAAPYAGPYPYGPAAPVAAGPYPYGPVAAPYAAGAYPHATIPFDKTYGYGPTAAHSVSHASYSGPYGAHYSYRRR